MCRVANRHVVKLAGPLRLLQSWIFWRFPGFRPAGYDTFTWPLALRWSGHNPTVSEKGPRISKCSWLIADSMYSQFIWMPYISPDVLQVVHPKILELWHTVLGRCVTALIYFVVIEWHQIDRVLPQFGGVQPRPQPVLDIDFLMSKDGRESRADHVLWSNVVPDLGPSHDFLDWWSQHGKRFLSPEMYLGDPRAVPIPEEATQRGAGRVPDMDWVDDVSDRRRVERRARVGTRKSQREWRWLNQAMAEGDARGRGGGRRWGRSGRRRSRAGVDGGHDEDDDAGDHDGAGGEDDGRHDGGGGGRIPGGLGGRTPGGMGRGGHGGDLYVSGAVDDLGHSGGGDGGGPFGDYFVGVPSSDQAVHDSQTWVSPGQLLSNLLTSDGYSIRQTNNQ
ncbi:hypothetical protein Ahy_B05g074403 [Arachis hypogaea]|uniref:Aminotransferase-like plant mobile domain-containing protein n=1 Tax=Arachis hypogaea TaxID=3818 RepID=A0A444YYS3_ARAHY|nr:hypothetical protein Ahy_B05g074403 [Arachis hypogaea]